MLRRELQLLAGCAIQAEAVPAGSDIPSGSYIVPAAVMFTEGAQSRGYVVASRRCHRLRAAAPRLDCTSFRNTLGRQSDQLPSCVLVGYQDVA